MKVNILGRTAYQSTDHTLTQGSYPAVGCTPLAANAVSGIKPELTPTSSETLHGAPAIASLQYLLD